MNELTREQQDIIPKIEKLLNLAAKAGTPEEAASATAKAQELLAKYNLDSAVLETNSGDKGKREQSKVDGGTYSYQRGLWRAVAALNFCFYWSQKYRTPDKVRQNVYVHGKYAGKKYVQVMRRRHAIVGRTVNTP